MSKPKFDYTAGSIVSSGSGLSSNFVQFFVIEKRNEYFVWFTPIYDLFIYKTDTGEASNWLVPSYIKNPFRLKLRRSETHFDEHYCFGAPDCKSREFLYMVSVDLKFLKNLKSRFDNSCDRTWNKSFKQLYRLVKASNLQSSHLKSHVSTSTT